MDIGQFMERERARCDVYKLLAGCFYQPQKALLLETDVCGALSNLLKCACPEAVPFSEHMAASLMRCDEEALLVEYARLFLGPNELLAPPYGSVYLEAEGRLMGETTARVMEIYRAEGLAMDEHFDSLPDHIAAELEFMHYLAFNEVAALEKGSREKALYYLKRQQEFYQAFLVPWTGPSCGKMREGTGNDFYRFLADCLEVFIQKTRWMGALPEELKPDLAQV